MNFQTKIVATFYIMTMGKFAMKNVGSSTKQPVCKGLKNAFLRA